MPPHRLLSRLRRAEESLPRREMNLDDLSESDLDLLERYLRRSQEVGSSETLTEMSEAQRLELEAVGSKVECHWRWPASGCRR